jgi:hypothetical protein
MLMAVAAATLLVLPNLLADEPSGSNEGQDGGMWAWRASKRYWELHGLAGRDPGKTCDDWSLPPWFVDVSQDDYLTECSDIRSNLKVPRPDLCCLSSYAKIILCLFSGTDGIHAGTHRGKGNSLSIRTTYQQLATRDTSSWKHCQPVIQYVLLQEIFVNTLFFAPKVVVELGVRSGCSSFTFEGAAR